MSAPNRRKAKTWFITFTLVVEVQEMIVTYQPNWMIDVGHFEFQSQHEPRRRIPISETGYTWVSLYAPCSGRKYLNSRERHSFLRTAQRASHEDRLFCLLLGLSGGGISEVLAVTPQAIDTEHYALTLHRRRRRAGEIDR